MTIVCLKLPANTDGDVAEWRVASAKTFPSVYCRYYSFQLVVQPIFVCKVSEP